MGVLTVLLISGSTRARSTNTALVRAVAATEVPGVATVEYGGLARLPQFNPDDDHDPLPPEVATLRSAIEQADAVLICTPEYAGTLPGSMKNLLDWTVGGTVMNGKPTAWVGVAADERRGSGATATLATVLRYVEADIIDVEPQRIPVMSSDVGDDGAITDPRILAAARTLLESIAATARVAGDARR